MSKLIVTRHQGLVDYLKKYGIEGDVISHLVVKDIPKNIKQVWGIFPLHMIDEINKLGIDVYNISLDLPPELRGKELTSEEMETIDVRINRAVLKLYPVDLEARQKNRGDLSGGCQCPHCGAVGYHPMNYCDCED